MLHALPKIRAPRNFMLTPERVKKPAKRQFFQPAWGLVSAVSTFLLLVIFAGSSILSRLGAFRGAAPEMAPVANDTSVAQKTGAAPAESPMIILWNPQRAFGMGGGGGGADPNGETVIGGGDGRLGLPGRPRSGSAPMPLLNHSVQPVPQVRRLSQPFRCVRQTHPR